MQSTNAYNFEKKSKKVFTFIFAYAIIEVHKGHTFKGYT